MYSSVDWSVTPRPIYPADGRKIPDIYSQPADLGTRLAADIGVFPFFNFWGPTADIRSSRWIAEASARVDGWHAPSLLLVYLPHLDYNLQRLGPDNPRSRADARAIDEVCGTLIARLRERGRRIIVLSEYGLVPVRRPVHINRVLREAKLLAVRDELGTEALDAGASEAFAVADHQVAHVYVRNRSRIAEVKTLLERVPGVDKVLDRRAQASIGLDHERAGELVAIAAADSWFTYYYWLDDRLVDPELRLPKLKIAATLAKKALGVRYLMKVIPLDATLVRGSHGRVTDRSEDGPVFISSERSAVDGPIESTSVRDLMLAHLFDVYPRSG